MYSSLTLRIVGTLFLYVFPILQMGAAVVKIYFEPNPTLASTKVYVTADALQRAVNVYEVSNEMLADIRATKVSDPMFADLTVRLVATELQADGAVRAGGYGSGTSPDGFEWFVLLLVGMAAAAGFGTIAGATASRFGAEIPEIAAGVSVVFLLAGAVIARYSLGSGWRHRAWPSGLAGLALGVIVLVIGVLTIDQSSPLFGVAGVAPTLGYYAGVVHSFGSRRSKVHGRRFEALGLAAACAAVLLVALS